MRVHRILGKALRVMRHIVRPCRWLVSVSTRCNVAPSLSSSASSPLRTLSSTAAPSSVVPIVDLSKDDKHCADYIRSACTQSGFFYVRNHGVSDALVKETFAMSRDFFAQPLAAKLALKIDNNGRGYSPYGLEYSDPASQPKHGDTKEGFAMGHHLPPTHALSSRPFTGPNQYPPQLAWKNTMDNYFTHMHDLALRLTGLVALSLDLPKTYFDPFFTHNIAIMRFLKYAPQISKPNEGIYGSGAHSDYGMITLLATDDQPGLQLYLKSNQWFDVTPIPVYLPIVSPMAVGTFIVNLGDMLQRWTNDRYRSTVHRVISTTGRERYSIPFFFEPNYDTIVQCLPSCATPENPAKYEPVQSGEYLLSKYQSTQPQQTVASKTTAAPSSK